MQDIVKQMWDHAAEHPAEEVCGLIISNSQKSMILKGVNEHQNKSHYFSMRPEVFLEVPDGWDVTATYHSHPYGVVNPSDADMTMCEMTDMPMHIVCAANSAHMMIEPSGYQAPYLKRSYVFGVHDCYTLVRDWYSREFSIDLPRFDEEHRGFIKGEDVYVQNFEQAGFIQLKDMPVCHGDVFLLQVGAQHVNHAVIWLKSGRILHHVVNRVSKEDHWTGYWVEHATHHLRHKTRL